MINVERQMVRIDVPCDGKDRTHGDPSTPYPHGKIARFSAWSLSMCLRKARKAGWRVAIRSRSLCPECKRREQAK